MSGLGTRAIVRFDGNPELWGALYYDDSSPEGRWVKVQRLLPDRFVEAENGKWWLDVEDGRPVEVWVLEGSVQVLMAARRPWRSEVAW